ncbi:hypothetical protein [Pontimicrobium sp. MEBiC01747]
MEKIVTKYLNEIVSLEINSKPGEVEYEMLDNSMFYKPVLTTTIIRLKNETLY